MVVLIHASHYKNTPFRSHFTNTKQEITFAPHIVIKIKRIRGEVGLPLQRGWPARFGELRIIDAGPAFFLLLLFNLILPLELILRGV